MNVAEWILVVILSLTLLAFLIVGIVLMSKLMGVAEEVRRMAIKGQDIAETANDIAENMKGMTSFGGTVGRFVNKYLNPKVDQKIREVKYARDAWEAKRAQEAEETKYTDEMLEALAEREMQKVREVQKNKPVKDMKKNAAKTK